MWIFREQAFPLEQTEILTAVAVSLGVRLEQILIFSKPWFPPR